MFEKLFTWIINKFCAIFGHEHVYLTEGKYLCVLCGKEGNPEDYHV